MLIDAQSAPSNSIFNVEPGRADLAERDKLLEEGLEANRKINKDDGIQRYNDRIVREEARKNARTRVKVMRALRNYLEDQGFVEITRDASIGDGHHLEATVLDLAFDGTQCWPGWSRTPDLM